MTLSGNNPLRRTTSARKLPLADDEHLLVKQRELSQEFHAALDFPSLHINSGDLPSLRVEPVLIANLVFRHSSSTEPALRRSVRLHDLESGSGILRREGLEDRGSGLLNEAQRLGERGLIAGVDLDVIRIMLTTT
jgi:hypothetical protein